MDKSEWMDEGGVNTGKIEVFKVHLCNEANITMMCLNSCNVVIAVYKSLCHQQMVTVPTIRTQTEYLLLYFRITNTMTVQNQTFV